MPATAPPSSAWSVTRLLAAIISAVFCLAIALCYAAQPDSLAAVTNWPPWVWALPALLLLLPLLRRPPRCPAVAAAVVWLGFLGLFQEEPRSLLRRPALSEQAFSKARANGRGVRVVCANCAGGQPEVALEAARLDPDILVLAESPSAAAARLARERFGDAAAVAQGPDVAIICRGKMDHVAREGAWYLTAARLELGSGAAVSVIGAHLTPPVFELDFLSPDHWRAQARNRRIRRGQAREIAQLAADTADRDPIILAGDLNCPQGDGSLTPLSPFLRDAFREGGVGWGNTVLNEFPVMRFDQVWCSSSLRALQVKSVRSGSSDHRIVIADLIWREGGT